MERQRVAPRDLRPRGTSRARTAVASAALAALLLGASAGGAATIQRRSLVAPSLGGATRDVRVYLPPSYATPAARERRYPLLVFMHGWPGSEGNWPGEGRVGDTLDSLAARDSIPEVIALFPDGAGVGTLGRSIWVNAAGGRSNLEDFLVRDLLTWADSTFRTRAGARYRGAIGLSDGGTAAVNLVFRHPDVYGACGSHSGDFELKRDFSSRGVFGPGPAGDSLRAVYSPLATVARAARGLTGHAIYFDCGTDDAPLLENRELDRKLRELGVPHTFREFPGGHDWAYWRAHVRESLRAVTAGMR